MTAHAPIPPHQPGAVPTTMPTGAEIHTDGVACPCQPCRQARAEELALAQLAEYLAAEADDIDDVLRLLDLAASRADLTALTSLHIEPGGEIEALEEAALRLSRLLDDLAAIPLAAEVRTQPADTDRLTIRHLDAAIRWMGARTQDMLSTIRRALS